jgi:hypothetical protein
MLGRFFNGFLLLGAAAVTAAALYWVTVEAFGLNYQSVFQGGLISAGLVGVAFLADLLPPRP